MAVRPILLYASSAALLRKKSAPLEKPFPGLEALVADLTDTLLAHPNGVGLAAPQIGVHLRVFVARLSRDQPQLPRPAVAVVDPVVVEAAREQLDFDGCLSIPGVYARTVRPHFLRLEGHDVHGQALHWTLEGFDAVVAHHEIDHLDGVLFTDRVTSPAALFTDDDPPPSL